MGETHRIEYKRKLTDNIEKEVIAFLNSKDGGFIYVGIDDDGAVVGVNNIDKLVLKIKDRIKNNIQPSVMGLFDVISEIKEDKDIVKIIVASGSEKPYYLKKFGMSEKGCFIRIGTASEPMRTNMIEDLFAKRTRNSLRKIASPRQDLSFEQLRIYYEEKGKPLNRNFLKNLELLTDDGTRNYISYLLADENGVSIKLAKYKGVHRTVLLENNEFGYCSVIKSAKRIIDKIDVENLTYAKITSKERLEKKLWNNLAIREAVLNAIVHNDYSNEVFPKFEIFDDRIEITSAGSLPRGVSREEFFEGVSVPRNKELMRIFKDLELVEQLGSGIPRILQYYSPEVFHFTENFIKVVFYSDTEVLSELKVKNKNVFKDTEQVTEQDTEQVTEQVRKLISVFDKEHSTAELMNLLDISHREYFRSTFLKMAIEIGLVEPTIPEKPTSSKQKYRLTQKGIEFKKKTNN